MENDPGLLVHLINFTLQIAAVVFALRMRELAEENAELRSRPPPQN